MSAESVDNSLLLEHLKALRADSVHIRGDLKEIKGRLSQVEIGIASIRGYNAAQSKMIFPDFPEFMISKPSM